MRVLVVGAGIAGLTAAWRIQQSGHDVTVLEAAPRVGGRTSSEDVGGFRIDRGAHGLLQSYARTRALAAEVGLDRQWFAFGAGAAGDIVRKPGQVDALSRQSPLSLLGFHGLGVPERVKLLLSLLESLRFRRSLDFFDLSLGPEAHDEDDVASFVTARLGSEAAEQVIDAFVRAFHFHGPEQISARYLEALLALLWQGERFKLHGFRGYLQALPDALAARLDVRCGVAVRGVVPQDAGWSVQTDDEALPTNRVVVATTGDVAARLLPEVPPRTRAVLDGAVYVPTMIAAFTTAVDEASAFEALWVPRSVSGLVSVVSNEASKGSVDGRRCVFSVGLHEEGARTVWEEADETVLDAIAREVERIVPDHQGPLEPLALIRWPSAMPVYSPGHLARVRRFWVEEQGQDGLFLCGDYLNHPFVEGAVRSGERAANGVLASEPGGHPAPGQTPRRLP